MGKNLKGKEIGKGICQRKDGLYVARFVNQYGKRCEKSFPALPLVRNWLEEARYANKHSEAFLPSNTTVDEWFNFLDHEYRRRFSSGHNSELPRTIYPKLEANYRTFKIDGREAASP